MIDNTPTRYVFIRACIFLLEYAPALEAALLLLAHVCILLLPAHHAALVPLFLATALLLLLALAELFYHIFLFRPHLTRLLRPARHPPIPPRAARERLFAKCLTNIPNAARYVRLWALGAPLAAIRRDNVAEFFRWAFFDNADAARVDPDELDGYVARAEALLGRPFPPGRGPATSLRLTVDPVECRWRSVVWYGIIALADLVTCARLWWDGFVHFAPGGNEVARVFPPRLRAVWGLGAKRRVSPSGQLGYWFRPHTARGRRPVVFIHGIGIGLLPYTEFLGEIARTEDGDGGQVGVLALEILPLSSRLTQPLLPRARFLAEVAAILTQHAPDWATFVLVAHSYGSVLTTHVLRDPGLGARAAAVVLVDPVSVLLHLPDVAYNFTRRQPRRANEWQLWYFASMDLGIAEGLGRHFFWRENMIWREELLEWPEGDSRKEIGEGENGWSVMEGMETGRKRKVAVFLAGEDLIVDTSTVARYLAVDGDWLDKTEVEASGVEKILAPRETDSKPTYRTLSTASGIDLFWHPKLDHAQIFETWQLRKPMVDAVRRCCIVDEKKRKTS